MWECSKSRAKRIAQHFSLFEKVNFWRLHGIQRWSNDGPERGALISNGCGEGGEIWVWRGYLNHYSFYTRPGHNWQYSLLNLLTFLIERKGWLFSVCHNFLFQCLFYEFQQEERNKGGETSRRGRTRSLTKKSADKVDIKAKLGNVAGKFASTTDRVAITDSVIICNFFILIYRKKQTECKGMSS